MMVYKNSPPFLNYLRLFSVKLKMNVIFLTRWNFTQHQAYEEIVGANLRGDRGEFFTPRNIMKLVVEMVNPRKDEKVLDSSCGTGGFLVQAMTHVIDQLEAEVLEDMEQMRATSRAQGIYNGFTNREAAEPLCRRCGYARRF